MNAPVRRKIFAVDDDPLAINALRAGADARGWLLEDCGLVDGAVDAIRSAAPDIVLLDLMLPDGDGLQILRKMRQTPPLQKTPVIVLTSRTDIEKRREAFAAGAQDYVMKPFDNFELYSRILVHLSEQTNSGETPSPDSETRLKERLRLDLVDMIVHDMRSPLSTLMLAVELLERKNPPRDLRRDFLNLTKISVETALLMMNDHLDVSSGKLQITPEKIRLGQLFQRLSTVMRPQFDQKGVTFQLDCDRDATLYLDGVIVFRVLQNLASNALKFSKRGATVTVRGSIADAQLTLEVIDRGPGIHDKTDVFERPRTSPSRDGTQGFGIGLRFCRMAASALNGSIEVHDATGGGSRFIFRCPAGQLSGASGL